jgi:hypothetical protein
MSAGPFKNIAWATRDTIATVKKSPPAVPRRAGQHRTLRRRPIREAKDLRKHASTGPMAHDIGMTPFFEP